MSAVQTLLTVEPLSAEAFAPFGDVLQVSDQAEHFTINAGNTERYHDLARLDPGPGGKVIASIFRGSPRTLPFSVAVMERHLLGSQAFMPLFGGGASRGYLVVVALPGKAPGAADLRCFLASASQGVNYAAGVWHHPLLALDTVSDFLVLDRSGPDDNCEEVALDPGALITL